MILTIHDICFADFPQILDINYTVKLKIKINRI